MRSLIWRWWAFPPKRQIKNHAKLTSYTVCGGTNGARLKASVRSTLILAGPDQLFDVQYRHLIHAPVDRFDCRCLVVHVPLDNVSLNKPSTSMNPVACKSKLYSVVRSGTCGGTHAQKTVGLSWWPCGLRRCHWLLAVSHHCSGSNPTWCMWESDRWLRFPPAVTTG